MELETEESVLFDKSTNPSLDRRSHHSPPQGPRVATMGQKAVVIPEEEEQLS